MDKLEDEAKKIGFTRSALGWRDEITGKEWAWTDNHMEEMISYAQELKDLDFIRRKNAKTACKS